MLSEIQFESVVRALGFAARKHRDQRRLDSARTPYINHPIALLEVLRVEVGIADEAVLCAALLHDTVEDTDATREEISQYFGERIASIVMEVTDDKGMPKAERKRLQIERVAGASFEARLVKLADKICNLRDIAGNPPQNWDLVRRQAYYDWARAVVEGIRGTHLELEELFDLAYAERP